MIEITKDNVADAHSLCYFWKDHEDMRRYVNFERAIEKFPDVKKALEDYEYAKHVLDLIVNELEEKISDHEYDSNLEAAGMSR